MANQYDLVIENTTIVDGTGRSAGSGSVGVTGGRIVAIGHGIGEGTVKIKGEGLVTCPGFVDIHSHADLSILEIPLAHNFVAQGITTVVTGNCGTSLAPAPGREYLRRIQDTWGVKVEGSWDTMAEWLSELERRGTSVNLVPLVGHNTVRSRVLAGDYLRRANDHEVLEMEKAVAQAMDEGAFGMSVGLDAAMPGHFAARPELVRLLKTVRRLGGLFVPHTRHHQNQWPAESSLENAYGLFQGPRGEIITGRYHGLLEAVELSAQADGVRLHIAHLTPAYIVPQPHPDYLEAATAQATLDIVDRASREGPEITFDLSLSPCNISSKSSLLGSLLGGGLATRPPWLASLSCEEFVRQLATEDFRRRLSDFIFSGRFKFGMIHPVTDPYWMDCFQIIECRDAEFVGRTIGDITRSRCSGNVFELVYEESIRTVFDLLARDSETTWALIRDRRTSGVAPIFLKHPRAMPHTDSIVFSPDDGSPGGFYGISPNSFGIFPYYLRQHVKENADLSLEEAIRKITTLPAREVLGIKDRSIIEKGAHADLVVLDFGTIRETSTFENPTRSPEGIRYVIVNGTLVYEEGKHTQKRPGHVLRYRHQEQGR